MDDNREMRMQASRYARQEILPEIGKEGQQRLGASSVLIVGCGALGCMQAELLARAGVGRMHIVDRDLVELTNLHRQIAFTEQDAFSRASKAEAAVKRLRTINSSIVIEADAIDVTPRNVESLIQDVDAVVDATDNFETRYLLNDACIKHEKPWVYGGVIGTEGVTLLILPGKGPCLRCLMPVPPEPGSFPTCDTSGVLNATAAIIASWQATAVLRLLVGSPPSEQRLVSINPWDGTFNSFKVEKAEGCSCCGLRGFEFLKAQRTAWTTVLCGRNSVQVTPPAASLDLKALSARLEKAGRVEQSGLVLRFQTDDAEMVVFADGRAIVMGTTDEARARGLYARYLGS
jgi:adenylyltransferase/sulfurtransferase